MAIDVVAQQLIAEFRQPETIMARHGERSLPGHCPMMGIPRLFDQPPVIGLELGRAGQIRAKSE
jgi:hypothetical protein